MLNSGSRRAASGQILSMIEGLHYFLKNNTGTTNDPTQDHYVLNEEGVLSNNRHFISDSAMEGQPNGDATTEGQSLLIIGYVRAYIGTGRSCGWMLEEAERYFDAYVRYFYAGVEPPLTPGRWVSNWIVNGKQPVLSNYPIATDVATHSGFKGVAFTFSAGQIAIPHGDPHWGEYLDKATFAFDGHLAWGAINATVVAVNADGSVDWSKDGTQYDVDWIVDSKGRKITLDGVIVAASASEAIGTVQLKDTTVTGSHFLNYATLNPVTDGGYMIARNECQHNRPLHVPVPRDFMGNSADSEQWFMEACYLLWKETGNQRYYRAWKACEYTVMEFTDIDLNDRFFRRSSASITPFTDGISYDYSYASGDTPTIIYGRDPSGYITIGSDMSCQHTLEQQAVWFKVDAEQSVLRSQIGGVDTAGNPLRWRVTLSMAPQQGENVTTQDYGLTLPNTTTSEVSNVDVPVSSLALLTAPDGEAYIIADERIISTYGSATLDAQFGPNVFDGRTAGTLRVHVPDDSSGFEIGAWLRSSGKFPVKSIIYKAAGAFDLRIVDDHGWRWYWVLPDTVGAWMQATLDPAKLVLSGYQPDATGSKPSAAVFTDLDQVTILPDAGASAATYFELFCLNDPPPTFTGQGFTIKYDLIMSGDAAFTALVGDCTILNYLKDALFCTPGVIPFSNIYDPGSTVIDAWHGCPYPGYQYPWIYVYASHPDRALFLNNMVEFLWESQQWYQKTFGIIGPSASTYIWNRWDNYKYGTPDTWTMYQWGQDTAWAGYQSRAFHAAAHAWYELVQSEQVVPENLAAYVENWLGWLIEFTEKSGGITPTEFPMDSVPAPVANDFTGHMTGLWLAGACSAWLAGSRLSGLETFIEQCVDELRAHYINTGIPGQIMNGSWSPAIRLETGNGPEANGMFFGFWAGEILRGLGLYMAYRREH
ncbi:hypothetical protein [Gluconobacter kondonii]|uniref:hypothetical protein n=1 Tax=Gluconobacter kondonii TaxID=941463 RepID=UPI001B8B8ADC|nr:hypothetical protein [Gluconobacter kondonii]MBS1079236.1 hypothetical protein [Gluconobacter kondonii]